MKRQDFDITLAQTDNDRHENDLTHLKRTLRESLNGYIRKDIETLAPTDALDGHVYTIETNRLEPLQFYNSFPVIQSFATRGWLPVTYDTTRLYVAPITPAETDDARYTLSGLDEPAITIPAIRQLPDLEIDDENGTETTAEIEDRVLDTLPNSTLEHSIAIHHLPPTQLGVRAPQIIATFEETSAKTAQTIDSNHALPLTETTHRLIANGLAPHEIKTPQHIGITTIRNHEHDADACRGYAYTVGKEEIDAVNAPEPCESCGEVEGHKKLVVDEETGHLINPEAGESEQQTTPVTELFCEDCAKDTLHSTLEEWSA